jgi:hypothetical protein
MAPTRTYELVATLISLNVFFHGVIATVGLDLPIVEFLEITLRRTTLGRTPLEE